MLHYVKEVAPCKIPTRNGLAYKTKQGATSVVDFGSHITITKTMFINT
jgi:hypothetical protein